MLDAVYLYYNSTIFAFSGNMYGYLVGAEDRWEYLVAGDPLRQIGSAEPEAKQGEVRAIYI